MKKKTSIRLLSLLLCCGMVLGCLPTVSFAANEDGLCQHHPAHTEECGYAEDTPCSFSCAECAAESIDESTTDTDIEFLPNALSLGRDVSEVNIMSTSSNISDRVANTYREALSKSGRTSFDGYCGLLVGWQLVVLGINTSYVGANGNNQFDTYKNMQTTSGGYQITAYPAANYSIKSALNIITNNGTKDAYNILIGFETGSGEAGQLYGHVVFIHGIIGNTVYFCESFDATIGGIFYSEGDVISCSIDTFANYYNSWTTLDGTIHFDNIKTEYRNRYHCDITFQVATACNAWTLPGSDSTYTNSEVISTSKIPVGTQLKATEIIENNASVAGHYWYKTTVDGKEAYIYVPYTTHKTTNWSVSVSGASKPTAINLGSRFDVKGTVQTGGSKITGIQGFVYPGNSTSGTPTISSVKETPNSTSYNLANEIDNTLYFNNISKAGYYTYVVKADLSSYYMQNNTTPTLSSKTNVILSDTTSYFTVGSPTQLYTVTLNTNGGACSVTSISCTKDSALGTLPNPTLDGYYFDGWYTEPYGGTEVTSATVPTTDMTLYAHYGHIGTKLVFDANGGTLPGAVYTSAIDQINNGRPGEALVIFNSNYGKSMNTNIYGEELAVNAQGKVIAVREYGDETQLTIPSGGFVLSGQSGWDSVNGVTVGGATFVWKIKELMKAGPVYISMNYETGIVSVFDSYAGYLASIKYGQEWTYCEELPIPTREGFLFDGWYSVGGSKVTYKSGYSGSNLTAYWVRSESAHAVARTEYNDHKYELFDYVMTWEEAKAFCEARGGYLATITDAAEQSAVASLVQNGRLGLYFIGATDAAENGVWKWVTGEAFSYSNWDTDYPEPSNGADEFYAAIMAVDNPPNKSVGEWVDAPNESYGDVYSKSNRGFVCEYEPEKTITFYDASGSIWRTVTVSKGTNYILPSAYPTSTDSYFSGWTYSENAEIYDIRPGDTVQIIEDICLYPLYVSHSEAMSGRPVLIFNPEDFSEAGYQIVEATYEIQSETDESYWTAWSDYQLTEIQSSDTVEVRTTAMYRYYYYLCSKCGDHNPLYGNCGCGGSSTTWYEKWSTIPYSQSNYSTVSYATYKCQTTSLGDGQLWYFSTGNKNSTTIGTIDSDSTTVVIRTGYSSRTYIENIESETTYLDAYKVVPYVCQHDYVAVVTEPTCTESGYTTHSCSKCGDSYVDSAVAATGHTEEILSGKAATCTETGLTEGSYCTVCGNVLAEQTVIDALGHTEIIDLTVDPTCTEPGLTEGSHCSVCGEIFVEQTVIDALGHTEVINEAVAPTCTESGLTEGSHCSVCGEILVAQTVIDALGHTEVIDEAVAPTCTESGLTEGKHCSVCGEVLVAQEIVPTVHNLENGVCTICGAIVGTCGDNLTWELVDGVLTISGSGDMTNYNTWENVYAPWYDEKENITTVVLQEGVTTVGDFSFTDCFSLRNVTISDGVTSIGYAAFCDCNDMNSITIPESVTSIGDFAFHGCISLTSITIPEGITSIGNCVYMCCRSLNSITIPDGVTSIGDYAFYGCSSLDITSPTGITQITIPAGVTSIGECAFVDCEKLTAFVVSEENAYFCAVDGVLFNKDRSEILAFPNAKSRSYSIPDGVTSIGSNAFYGCSSLSSISLPEGVTSIGSHAFYGCSSLSSISIPASVTSIADRAFCVCDNLSVVHFLGDGFPCTDYIFGRALTAYYPNGNTTWTQEIRDSYGSNVTWVEACPVEGPHTVEIDPAVAPTCTETGLTEGKHCSVCGEVLVVQEIVPAAHHPENGVCTICGTVCGTITGSCGENLTWVLTTDGVLTISGSGNMTDYSYSSSAPWYQYSSMITSVIVEQNVTTIGNFAFRNCSSLINISIPESVGYIGECAFLYCRNLSSITIPEGVSSINKQTFNGCSNLSSISIPESVTAIGQGAFYYCSSLNNIAIPKGVTSIGDNAFARCRSLSSITIPKGVTSIEESTFLECVSLSSITIPESVTSIGDWAFAYCSGLNSISIPESVTSIGGWAFWCCSNLTSITIPEVVTSIGEYAFSYCRSLSSISIPASVTAIGQEAFYYCNNLTEVHFLGDGFLCTGYIFDRALTAFYPNGNTTWTQEIRDSFGSDVTWEEICTAGGAHEEVIDEAIPATHVTEGLTEGSHCSVCGQVLTQQNVIPMVEVKQVITLPAALKVIQEEAFVGSPFLCVVLPEGCLRIEAAAFQDCEALLFIEIPDSVTFLDATAFAGCSENLIIITTAGSAAEAFALEYGITCVLR